MARGSDGTVHEDGAAGGGDGLDFSGGGLGDDGRIGGRFHAGVVLRRLMPPRTLSTCIACGLSPHVKNYFNLLSVFI